MATEFKLPELGENIESGDLVRLMIKPGASIAEGEPVMELETDKAVVEVPSSVTGTIGEIRVKEGDKLRVGQVIFTVENGAGAGKEPASKSAKPPAPPAPQPGGDRASAPVAAPPVAVAPSKPPAPPQPERPATSPAAVSTASEFKLPELGENIDSGDLVRLMISPGTTVSEGQPVMELETDKAVVEVPSSVTGTIGEAVSYTHLAVTIRSKCTPRTRRRRNTPDLPPSFSRRPSKAMDSAKRAKARTSRISRKS